MTGVEILVLIAFICFCLTALFVVIFAIIDYKETKRWYENMREIEHTLKITGDWWRL